MPIPSETKLAAIPGMIAEKIATYNKIHGSKYNNPYAEFIAAREAGIEMTGNLSNWIAKNGTLQIRSLLVAFGMNARNSQLVPDAILKDVLSSLNPIIVNWIANMALPLDVPPPNLVNPYTKQTLSDELGLIYNLLSAPGSISDSGGYVAASKTMHCLFPKLVPIIDGTHTGISYYSINRATYVPPLSLGSWEKWVGMPIIGVANPSPRGAGRNGWQWHQFMAAIGVNQHIYELWQAANRNIGLQAFMDLDPTPGTSGIPRIIDKGLW